MSALIDEVILGDLARLGQSPEFVERIIGVYLAEAGELVTAIEAAAVVGDYVALQDRAHALHGTSANVGALGVRALARALEYAAVEDLNTRGPIGVARLAPLFAATKGAMIAYLARGEANRVSPLS